MIPGLIEEKNPCYMFYRLDEKNGSGSYVWLFLAYTPDLAVVRDWLNLVVHNTFYLRNCPVILIPHFMLLSVQSIIVIMQ